MRWLRAVFLELIAQPLIWFLGNPRVSAPYELRTSEPMVIICNHVTAYDGALVEYALPGHIRRWTAAAMLGEMLEDFRRFRNPDTAAFMPLDQWRIGCWSLFTMSSHYPDKGISNGALRTPAKPWTAGTTCSYLPEGARSSAGKPRHSGPESV